MRVLTDSFTARLHHALLRTAARTGTIRRAAIAIRHVFPRPRPVVVELDDGGLLTVNLGDIYWSRLLVGWPYEAEVEQAVVAALQLHPAAVLLDCGANIGYWGARFSRDAHVVGVEAVPGTFAQLEHNARTNNFVALNRAVWHTAGDTIPISYSPQRHDAASAVYSTGPVTALVETTSLDQLYAEHGKGGPVIVKLDVEGAELAVVDGGEGMLDHALLVYEDHGSDPGSRVTSGLLERGLSVFTLEAGGPRRVKDAQELRAVKEHRHRGYNFGAFRQGGDWSGLWR